MTLYVQIIPLHPVEDYTPEQIKMATMIAKAYGNAKGCKPSKFVFIASPEVA